MVRSGPTFSNTGGVWNVTGSSLACGTPCPFSVRTCSSIGPFWSLRSRSQLRQRRQVVAVDRAEVAEAQLLEQHAAVEERLHRRRASCSRAEWAMPPDERDLGSRSLMPPLRALVEAGHAGPGRGTAPAPPMRGQIDILLSLRMTSRFWFRPPALFSASKTMPDGEGAVADDGDAVAVAPRPSSSSPTFRPRHGRDAAAGVAGHEQVVVALVRVGVAHQAAAWCGCVSNCSNRPVISLCG